MNCAAITVGQDVSPPGHRIVPARPYALSVPQSAIDNLQSLDPLSDLRKSGVLAPDSKGFRFTQDYTFNSPSLASAVVLGRSSNGRVDWKTASGQTLKQLQEAEAKNHAAPSKDEH